jgi:hypothetical protein
MNRLIQLAVACLGLSVITACDDKNATTVSATSNTDANHSGVILRPRPNPIAAPSPNPSTGANASAQLSWQAPSQNTDGSALTNISGYHIHVGTDPSALGTIIDVTDASAISYTVNNLTSGTWYFGISAYNTAGVDGEISNIGSKTVG